MTTRSISVFDLPRSNGGRYSVEAGTVLHHRYQDHAPGAYRTTADGVRNITATGYVDLCPICFPRPPVIKRAARPSTGYYRPIVPVAHEPAIEVSEPVTGTEPVDSGEADAE